MRRYLPLICLSLTHTLVDTAALLIAPLWPKLGNQHSFGMAGLSMAFIIHAMPTSLSQVVFGYLHDRRPAPVWLWLGPALGVLFMPLVGLAPGRAALFAVLIIGGVGIGGFHPEAAVLAGRLIPNQRTRGLSIFMFGGSLGLAIGPILGGSIVSNAGLSSLAWLIAPFLLMIAILGRVGRLNAGSVGNDLPTEAGVRPSTAELLHGRVGFALVLLLVCSLRLVPNMAMDKVLSFALETRGFNEAFIGRIQAVFLMSASVGMFLMAWLFRPGWEKQFMIWCPLTGIPLMWALSAGDLSNTALVLLLIPTGIVLWGTVPAMVSYAQQRFPRGAGVASAITMGLSWGMGSLIQAPITASFAEAGRVPQHAFLAFIPCLLVSAAIAWFLPSIQTQAATDGEPAESTGPVQAARSMAS